MSFVFSTDQSTSLGLDFRFCSLYMLGLSNFSSFSTDPETARVCLPGVIKAILNTEKKQRNVANWVRLSDCEVMCLLV
jgi:hypothetical protein